MAAVSVLGIGTDDNGCLGRQEAGNIFCSFGARYGVRFGGIYPVQAEFFAYYVAETDINECPYCVTVNMRSLAPERRDHADLLSDLLRQKIDAGAALAPERVAAAEALAESCRGQLDALFGERDVIVAPPSPGEAPDAATTGNPLFNRMWNLLRVPALTLPIAKGPSGLPLGAHILARPGDETVLLRAAHWIERACGPI